MDFESKIISREINLLLWEQEKTLGTAESCTGGRIAEAIIAVPGASKYFKGGVISYTDDVKESVLGVDRGLLEEKTAVCEEVASRRRASPVPVVVRRTFPSAQSGLRAARLTAS